MKKYLMFGLAALAFASCSKNDLTTYTPEEIVKAEYDAKFIAEFGNPNPNHDWGFGASTRAFTRTISAKNGDAYDVFPSAADVAAYFPTAIPDGADEVSGLLDKYYGKTVSTQYGDQTLWGIYQIYQFKIVEGYNLKVTNDGTYENNVVELGGNYQNAGWDGEAQMNVAYPYNVYVNVDGDLTIRRVGATHFNLYILKGNVTLESNYGEQAGLISVAAGATLNDQRNSIAANQGVSIYNRGTINATNTEKYDIGNFCKVYNESKFNVTGALTYSPGDANNSYFVNLGDGAELTAPSMTLNSTGNFFNSGKAKITGETKCTQARLYWVNDGFYETGTMTFSAKNTTFYNYCQLIVKGNAHMYDGEFNLMTNSYTEAGTAEFDNFFINMYGSTGMYVKGNVKLEAQGDGTFQGFKNKDNAANKYWLVDGKVTIASHKQTLNIQSGITYSINQMEIIKGGNVVTEEYLQSINDGDYPVTVLEGTECPYGKLTVTPNTNSCGAIWTVSGAPSTNTTKIVLWQSGRVFCEDLGSVSTSDIDYNDVVFDAWIYVKRTNNDESKDVFHCAFIQLLAAGGTLPIQVAGEDVHEKFGVAEDVMINTYREGASIMGSGKHAEYGTDFNTMPAKIVITNSAMLTDSYGEINIKNIPIVVRNGNWAVELNNSNSEEGASEAPLKFMAPIGTMWPAERVRFGNAYERFSAWVANPTNTPWEYPNTFYTYKGTMPNVREYAPTEAEIAAANPSTDDDDIVDDDDNIINNDDGNVNIPTVTHPSNPTYDDGDVTFTNWSGHISLDKDTYPAVGNVGNGTIVRVYGYGTSNDWYVRLAKQNADYTWTDIDQKTGSDSYTFTEPLTFTLNAEQATSLKNSGILIVYGKDYVVKYVDIDNSDVTNDEVDENDEDEGENNDDDSGTYEGTVLWSGTEDVSNQNIIDLTNTSSIGTSGTLRFYLTHTGDYGQLTAISTDGWSTIYVNYSTSVDKGQNYDATLDATMCQKLKDEKQIKLGGQQLLVRAVTYIP